MDNHLNSMQENEKNFQENYNENNQLEDNSQVINDNENENDNEDESGEGDGNNCTFFIII